MTMERSSTLDLSFHITDKDNQHLAWLSRQLARGKLVVFLGAGVSRNAIRHVGSPDQKRYFPLWQDLNSKLIEMIEEEDGEDELSQYIKYWSYPKVAGVFASRFGRDRLISLVEEILDPRPYNPGSVHHAIARMRWADIITTNYDDFIERSFAANGITPHVIAEDSMIRDSMINAEQRKPWIIKMNGCLSGDDHNRIVIDDEDFRRYATNRPIIELFVKKSFIENYVLFIGFSMNDPAFQNIFGWVRDNLKGRMISVYSMQWDVSDAEREYWERQRISVIELHPKRERCLDCSDSTRCDKDVLYGLRLQEVLEKMQNWAKNIHYPLNLHEYPRPGKVLVNALSDFLCRASGYGSTDEYLRDQAQGLSGQLPTSSAQLISPYLDPIENDSTRELPIVGDGDESFLFRLAQQVACGAWWEMVPDIKRFAMRLTSIADISDEMRGFYLLDDFYIFVEINDSYRRERWERLFPRGYGGKTDQDTSSQPVHVTKELLRLRMEELLDDLSAGRYPIGTVVRQRLRLLLDLMTRLADSPRPTSDLDTMRRLTSLALMLA
jgi:hypothetical protein